MWREYRTLPWALAEDEILEYLRQIATEARENDTLTPLDIVRALHEMRIRQDELWKDFDQDPVLEQLESWLLEHWLSDSELFVNLARPWVTELPRGART